MLSWILQNVVSLLTVAVAAIGIPLILKSLQHARSANFVSAWQAISDRLQGPEVLPGRVLLRCLYDKKQGEDATDAEILEVFKTMKDNYSGAEWYRCLTEELAKKPAGEKEARLREVMAEAFGVFDLVGILAINSRIPGLLDVVVVEWLDSIIKCFEQGGWVLRRRLDEKRTEQYQCFSLMYIRACRRRDALKKLDSVALIGDPYPFRGNWFQRWFGDRQLYSDALSAAKDRAKKSSRSEAVSARRDLEPDPGKPTIRES